MLSSLAMIFLLGFLLSFLFGKCKLPGFLGLLLTGIFLGSMGLLDENILLISPDLRQIALIIILTRAGLTLDLGDLKQVGRPALLMCFVPAVFEMIGVVLLAPVLLGITLLEAAVMGSVLAAVSPAVVVPRMIGLIEQGIGTEKSIPQLIMAGASVDDVFVIVLFTSFSGIAAGGSFDLQGVAAVPVSIIVGLLAGAGIGLLLVVLFRKIHIRDTMKVLVLLGVSFALVSLEKQLPIPMSGLIAVMAAGVVLLAKYPVVARRLSAKFSKLWVGAEVLLFVLVGASVDVGYALSAGFGIIAVILGALLFRMCGVLCCLLKTPLNFKERLFCVIAYLPKATVQAAIGGLPLAMGLACGSLVLTAAVTAIVITAPISGFLMDRYHGVLLGENKAS